MTKISLISGTEYPLFALFESFKNRVYSPSLSVIED
jgi:hypothetical protein